VKSKFQLFKDDKAPNPMREVTKPEKEDDDKDKKDAKAK
jgi:hypothetical protein